MMTVLDKSKTFVRCHNSLEVPESMCTLCLHTFVARDLQTLEQAEIIHSCYSSEYERAITLRIPIR